MTPDVSVIIPTRNALVWLPTAIASIGPDPRVEILVIDDGSTDGSADWLAQQAAADSRLRVLPGGGDGPSVARNLAIPQARGQWCAFLDADDCWAPGKLDVQLALHRACPELGFSFTDYRHVTVFGEDRGPCFAYWSRFAARHGGKSAPFILDRALSTLFAENVVGTSTVLARTDLLRHIGGFSTWVASAEDWQLWLAMAILAPVGVVPTVLTDYLMQRPGAMTRRVADRVLALQTIGIRYRDLAEAEDPSAGRIFDARLAGAKAELAELTGNRLRATWLRLGALVRAPCRRAAYDLAGTLRRTA